MHEFLDVPVRDLVHVYCSPSRILYPNIPFPLSAGRVEFPSHNQLTCPQGLRRRAEQPVFAVSLLLGPSGKAIWGGCQLIR